MRVTPLLDFCSRVACFRTNPLLAHQFYDNTGLLPALHKCAMDVYGADPKSPLANYLLAWQRACSEARRQASANSQKFQEFLDR